MSESLNQIATAYFVASDTNKVPLLAREHLLTSAGVSADRIVLKTEDGKPLATSIEAQDRVLADLMVDTQQAALRLMVFTGRIKESWEDLVLRLYRAVFAHTATECRYSGQLDGLFVKLKNILDRIAATRLHFEEFLTHSPDEKTIDNEVENLVSSIRAEVTGFLEGVPDCLRDCVHKQLILVMLSGGEDYMLAGKVAAKLGLIDGAFLASDIAGDPSILKRFLEEAVASRQVG